MTPGVSPRRQEPVDGAQEVTQIVGRTGSDQDVAACIVGDHRIIGPGSGAGVADVGLRGRRGGERLAFDVVGFDQAQGPWWMVATGRPGTGNDFTMSTA